MAVPRVFISSTCYDLRHIRESLRYFVRTVGYDPVLSDDGDVFYSPTSHTHDSCLKEVETCQIFVLIIGGRYGGKFKDGESSITNNEYREAIKNSIPVFALVESSVHADFHLHTVNKKNDPDLANKIVYPSIDNIKIFGFLDEVRKSSVNNAIFAFRDFSDIESYLRKQWAGMMFDFLARQNTERNSKLTNRLLDDLSLAARKSEELIKILLKTSKTEDAESVINSVDIKVEAMNFARLVLNQFQMEHFTDTTVEELEGIPLDESWYEFLLNTDDFWQDDFPGTDDTWDRVLFSSGKNGLRVGYTKENQYFSDSFPDLERAYSALKKADPAVRRQVFEKLVNGFTA